MSRLPYLRNITTNNNILFSNLQHCELLYSTETFDKFWVFNSVLSAVWLCVLCKRLHDMLVPIVSAASGFW